MTYARTVNRRPSNDCILTASVAWIKHSPEKDPFLLGVLGAVIDTTLDQYQASDATFDKALCLTLHTFLYDVWMDFSYLEPYLWKNQDQVIEILKQGAAA